MRQLIRRWTRRPTFAITAVAVVAVGIAAPTAMFSIVKAVLLAPSPWPEPSRLVIIHAVQPDQRSNPSSANTWNRAPLAWATWVDLRNSKAFTGVGAWIPGQQILGDSQPELVATHYASSSFLSVLGVVPSVGRSFTVQEDDESSDAVILSHEAWHNRFGGREDIIGSRLTLKYTHSSRGTSKTVVGVLPPGFVFQGERPEFLLPMGLMAFNGSFETNRFLRLVGRLSAGTSIAQAQGVVEPLVRRSEPPGRRTARTVSLTEDRFGPQGRFLWLALGGATLLLLIGSSSLGGMLAVDGRSREPEVRMRVALGATRMHLVRALALESFVLSCIGGGLGVCLALWFTPVLLAKAPAVVSSVRDVPVEYSVAVVGWAIAFATCLFAGVLAGATRLRGIQRSSSAPVRIRGHHLVVVIQLALALTLLSCASFLRAVVAQLEAQALGFTPESVAVVSVRLLRETAPIAASAPVPGASQPYDRTAVEVRRNAGWTQTRALLEKVAAVPGVVAAAGSSVAPFVRPGPLASISEPGSADEHQVMWQAVTEDYFRVLGIPLVRGKTFEPTDRDIGTPYWVVVSSAEEQRLRSGDPIGADLRWAQFPFRVIGVVGDIQAAKGSVDRESLPTMYVINFRAEDINHILVKTSSGDSRSVLAEVRRTIEADGALTVTSSNALSDLIAESLRAERFLSFASAAFGVLALTISAIGLFGLIGHLLTLRQQEIAIRLALGETVGGIRQLVVRDAAKVVLLGSAIGLPAAYSAVQLIRSQLVGNSLLPINAEMWVNGIAAVVFAAGLASAAPLRRSGRVDPATLLRN